MPLPFFDPDDPLGINKLLGFPPAALGPAPTQGYIAPSAPQYGGTPDTVSPPPPVATLDPAYNAQTQQFQAQQGVINARQGVNTAQRGVVGANYGVNQAQQAQMPFTMASLNANRGVLSARQATFPAQQGVIGAQGAVNAAQGVQVAGNRSLIEKTQAENNMQRQEYETQQAAQNNVADQVAVASFKRYQAVSDARNRALGIAPDVEVDAAPGTLTLGGQLAPGVRARATTQADDVAKVNKDNQTRRGFDLESAKLAVQLMGTDVDQARLVAAQAGLTLDQAQLAVSQAENAAGFARNAEDVAGLGVTQARLNANRAGLGVDEARLDEDVAQLSSSQADLDARVASRAPFPGAEQYTDPFTGRREWMTPAEADQLEYQYETSLGVSRIPTSVAVGQQRQLAEKAATTQGSTLAAQTNQQLLDQYNRISPPGATITPTAIKNELTRRLISQGYNEAQAASAAQQLIDVEMENRRQAAQKANQSATSGITVAPPAPRKP